MYAFDGSLTTSWQSAEDSYTGGVCTTTYMTDYPAEVIFIDLGESIVLDNFIIGKDPFAINNIIAPKQVRMYATNDSNTFNEKCNRPIPKLVDYQVGTSWIPSVHTSNTY